MQMKRVAEAEEYQVLQRSITFTLPINTEIHNLVYIDNTGVVRFVF